MSADKPDPHSELRAAFSAGAMILANEGRHGRPDTYHALTDPQFTCEPHEYLAVVPYAVVADLINENKRISGHREEAVKFIEANYPDAPKLDRGPILGNMRRLARKLRAALARVRGGAQ